MNIQERSRVCLNLEQYAQENAPEQIEYINLNIPEESQYILRCLIQEPFGEIKIPEEMLWCESLIKTAVENQQKMGIRQPFCYITIRSGEICSETDDEWHVDGFSQTITHLPEQNYIWTNKNPTEYVIQGIDFPDDFDSQKHNIHSYIQDILSSENIILQCKEKVLYCLDPYVIHKRPSINQSTKRAFIRITFSPIEIMDCNNTQNPYLPRNHSRDGVKDFRDSLVKYQKN